SPYQAGTRGRIIVDGATETSGIAEADSIELSAGIERLPRLVQPILAIGIEVLEREPDGIHQLVAASAGGLGPVRRQTLAHRLVVRIVRVLRGREVDVSRRRRNGLT